MRPSRRIRSRSGVGRALTPQSDFAAEESRLGFAIWTRARNQTPTFLA